MSLGTACLNNHQPQDKVLAIIYACFHIVLHVVLLVVWWSHRSMFQVRQRSPQLVTLAILNNVFVINLLPIWFASTDYHLNPNRYIDKMPPSLSQDTSIRFAHSLYSVAQISMSLIIILRNVRIYVVLQTEPKNKYFREFIKKEYMVVFLYMVVMMTLTMVQFQNDTCNRQAFFGHSNDYTHCHSGLNEFYFYWYWFIVNLVESNFIPLSFLVNTKIPHQFSMNTESFVAFLTYCPTYLILMKHLNQEDSICLSFLQSKYFIADLRNTINICFTVLYPIYLGRRNRFHFLPCTRQKKDYMFFLFDPQLYKVFSSFVADRQAKLKERLEQEPNLKQYQHAHVYLYYIHSMQTLVNQPPGHQQLKRQLLSLVLNNIQAFNQPDLQYHIEQLRNKEQHSMSPDVMGQMYTKCLYKVEKYFQDFLRTKSYQQYVVPMLKHYDVLNQRLIDFGMESQQN